MSDNSQNTQENRSMATLFKLMDDKKWVLPEFQRDFKWTIEKSVTLFDSIIRNLFIGSLIISKPKFDLACKDFDLRERGHKGRKPAPSTYTKAKFDNEGIYTLLDGQQRATSIYRALTNKDEIFVVFELNSKLFSKKFYDRDSDSGIKIKVDHEEYLVGVDSKKPKGDRLYLRIGDLYKAGEMRESIFWEKFVNPLIEEFNLDDEEMDILRDYAATFQNYFWAHLFLKDSLLSVQLLDMDLEKFCLYFERSNSQGLNLSFTDIITAKVYIDFRLSKAIAKAKKMKYFDEKLVDPTVRYINYIENGEVTKKSILSDLRGEHFTKHWASSVKDLTDVKAWLDDGWCFNAEALPYRTMLLPLLAFYQNLRHKDFSQATSAQLGALKFWFYASMVDHRYGGGGHGSTNVVIKDDCTIMTDLAKGNFPPSDYWASMRVEVDFEELKRTDNHKSAKMIGLAFYSWHKEKYKNFENDHFVQMKEFDVHHMFPVDYVKKRFGINSNEFDYVDSVLNKVRIAKIPNILIGNKVPSTYLNNIYNQKNKKLSESLSSHGITCCDEFLSGTLDDDFFGFLEKRYTYFESNMKEIALAGKRLADGYNGDVWKQRKKRS